jgi:hypothetical protein
MNYRNTLIAAAVAALVPLAGTALADDSHKSGKAGASFDALDTNRDGRISRAEASADSKIVFAQADANGDGYIDTAEYAKAKKSGDTTTTPEPQSQSSYPNDASGQQTEPVSPTDPSTTEPPTTPPSDTETPRQ